MPLRYQTFAYGLPQVWNCGDHLVIDVDILGQRAVEVGESVEKFQFYAI